MSGFVQFLHVILRDLTLGRVGLNWISARSNVYEN